MDSPSPSPSPRLPDPAVLSVRIVSIDYYMAPPIPGVDFCYSPLHGREVVEVPVIRIYGSTPAGQKTCLHVHRALPYLYIPCPCELLQNRTEGDKEIRNMMISIEKALENRSTSAPKRQHVHGYNLVRAKNFYGYHSTEDVFLKIYLYYPSEVARAASLLLGGAVLSRSFQPFESHIPFLLQFLVDYNLFGMGHIHISQLKFRLPLPYDITSKASNQKKEDSGERSLGNSAIWLSSTVPSTLIWSESDTTQGQEGTVNNSVKRQSVCELEADSSVDDILNEKNKIYTSLSQTRSEVKMVQSLIPIWEEYEQSARQEAAKLPDYIKPCPAAVLKSFHEGFEYDNVLLELLENGEELQKFSAVEGDEALEDKLFTDNISKSLDDRSRNPAEETNLDQIMTGSSNQKNMSTETLGVLSWFASSQAAEDLNSDDELAKEAILTPLFSRRSYEKALEMAHSNYDNVSQQECQDILDSVECLPKSDEPKNENTVASHGLSDGSISQADDSPDNGYITPEKFDPFQMNRSVGRKKPSTMHDRVGTKQDIKFKNNEHLWGPLPFSTSHKENRNLEISSCFLHDNLLEDTFDWSTSSGKKEDKSCGVLKVDTDQVVTRESMDVTLTSCSVRDLMRKKRRFRSESIESERDSIDSLIDKEKTQKRSLPLDVGVCNILPDTSCEGSAPILQNIVSSAVAEEHIALRDDNIFMSTKDGKIVQQSYDDTQASSYFESDFVLDKSSPQVCESGNSQLNIGHKSCETLHSPVGSVEMRFKGKPPSKDEMLSILENSSADRRSSGDLPPFFQRNFVHTEPCQLMHVEEPDSHRDSSLLPTHFQNDGSVLYLLTHATSAPSFDSVHRWIAEESKDRSNKPTGNSKNLPPSDPSLIFRNIFEDDGRKNESLIQTGVPCHPVIRFQDSCHSTSEDSNDLHCQLSSSQEKEMNLLTETSSCYVPISEGKPPTIGTEIKQDNGDRSCHDVSQISGPYRKLNLTPLSQSGFRDPAGAGCGQQLTLISLEVQAESRGDLRPDPQFDAVNIIALAVQEDANPATAIFVLMRGNNDEPQKKNIDGIVNCTILVCYDEKQLLNQFISIISSLDPDILMGWEIQGGSLGFLAERSAHLGVNLLKRISRTSLSEAMQNSDVSKNLESVVETLDTSIADDVCEVVVIDDEWGRNHASGIHVGGRIVLNIWRLVRSEVKLNMYSFEAVVEEVLRRKIPSIPSKVLNLWFSSGPGQVRYRCIEYVTERAKLNIQILNQLDLINRTSELARVFGIDFFSVLSRGSQFRVESMLLRLAHTQNYLAISPGSQQVALQPAMECLPLVMEPESRFYVDPVVVLDFQSLYPSMIIAYNLCFSTCLGKVFPSRSNVLGVSSYSADPHLFKNLQGQLLLTPNGIAYVPPKVRQGVLPRLLEEILSTRIMVKQAMKKLLPSQKVLERIFNARQLALKLIANVTYGYTAAGFSGRMPCAEIADSIVQCGRRTLENAISFVNKHPKWRARVVYGDTDSLFVLLRGRTLEAAFEIGNEIASAITAMNPTPVTLKLEKVYKPCFLLTKKRYVGYSYQSPDQEKATFDAKGIETVRRDTCPAVAKILEQSLRLMFEYQDISRVKSYLQRQWTRILSGKVTLQDFVFAKEVRLGTYSVRNSSLPPAAIVAIKAMNVDPRAEPRYGERVPYVVIHGEPGARLIDMVVDPYVLLDMHSRYRLNDLYYISKQIIPALQRVFGLLGVDLSQLFREMPRPARTTLPSHSHMFHLDSIQDYDDSRIVALKKIHMKNRIDTYYTSKHCTVCGELVEKPYHLCDVCKEKRSLVATIVIGRTSKLEREIQHLAAICRHCGGGDWVLDTGVQCTSLACSVFFERRKVQKALQAISPLAHETGSHPRCRAELF